MADHIIKQALAQCISAFRKGMKEFSFMRISLRIEEVSSSEYRCVFANGDDAGIRLFINGSKIIAKIA